jgi:hypothetical protein
MLQDGVDLWANWIEPRLQSIFVEKEKMQAETNLSDLQHLAEEAFCCVCLDLGKDTFAPYEDDGFMYCDEHCPQRDAEPATSDIIPGCTFGPTGTIEARGEQMEAENKQKWLQGYVK